MEEVQQVDKEILHKLQIEMNNGVRLQLISQQWSETATDITVNEFTESLGPTFPLSSEPVDAFLELFPEQLINVIVTETNRYAAECLLASHNGDGLPPT